MLQPWDRLRGLGTPVTDSGDAQNDVLFNPCLFYSANYIEKKLHIDKTNKEHREITYRHNYNWGYKVILDSLDFSKNMLVGSFHIFMLPLIKLWRRHTSSVSPPPLSHNKISSAALPAVNQSTRLLRFMPFRPHTCSDANHRGRSSGRTRAHSQKKPR